MAGCLERTSDGLNHGKPLFVEVVTDFPYNSFDPDVREGNPLWLELGTRACGHYGYDLVVLADT